MELKAWEVGEAVEAAGARVYAGLRRDAEEARAGSGTGTPAWDDVAELACLLLDWGRTEPEVAEVVELRREDVGGERLRALARRLLDVSGYDPGFRLAPERLGRLCHALDLAARDLPARWAGDAPRLAVQDCFGREQAVVELSGGYVHGMAIAPSDGDTAAGALAAVADLLQETVMERHWQVWPVCAVHGLGLHARTRAADAGTGTGADGSSKSGSGEGAEAEEIAVWHCEGGGATGHVVGRIGELG